MTHRKTLVLDFDGTIHAYTSKWTSADEVLDGPVPGAMAFLVDAMARFDVAVVSSRSHAPGGIEAMSRAITTWLCAEGPFAVNHTDPANLYVRRIVPGEGPYDEGRWQTCGTIRFPLHKPPAHLTLDDRALTFQGTWPSLDALEGFVPWNKPGGTPLPEWHWCLVSDDDGHHYCVPVERHVEFREAVEASTAYWNRDLADESTWNEDTVPPPDPGSFPWAHRIEGQEFTFTNPHYAHEALKP